MKDSYTTLLHAGESEYTEKRSRFLGHARPCKSEEEALRFLSEMRKIYSDARHNVYAYLLSDGNLMRYSDDAEPQGTAGMPVLEVLAQKRRYRRCGRCDPVFRRHLARHRGIGARLFAAAAAALENAEIVTYREAVLLTLTCDYSEYGRISALLPSFTYLPENTEFTDAVTLRLLLLREQTESFSEKLRELTAGKVTPQILESRFALF